VTSLAVVSLSSDARSTAGILLLTLVAVESGGILLLRIARGRVSRTSFQQAFSRAGHAHAGVLVTLALVGQVLADAADMGGLSALAARDGIPAAAVLMPAGFFLSAAGGRRNVPFE